MDGKIINFKKKLGRKKIRGLALDIDETLSFTMGYLVEKLSEKFGNPDNLTARDVFLKYHHTSKVPYWQGEEVEEAVKEIIDSNEIQKNLPLIENANLMVQKIDKLIPIVAYITARPMSVIEGTKFWLKKHGFPEAELITKPEEVKRSEGNEWKAGVLRFLYPEVVGIVDDNPDLVEFLGNDYRGMVFLYDRFETKSKSERIVPCESWEMVAKKVKESINKL